jgi:hypothetical protein
MLSSVSGVYLILDTKSDRQYVGSAYGVNGIRARWSAYVRKPSGGDLLLVNLLSTTPEASANFQFSILRVLESGATRDEVLTHEALLKPLIIRGFVRAAALPKGNERWTSCC